MSAFTFQLPFVAGAISVRSTTLGVEAKEDRPSVWHTAPHLAQLRVGFLHPEDVAERWIADLHLVGIGPVGPIDLPFTYNVEQPVQVKVQPLTAPAKAQKVSLVLCDLPNATWLDHATHYELFDVEAGQTYIVIPHWVIAVTVYGSGTAQFQDDAGTGLGYFQGQQPVARPRNATRVYRDTDVFGILFHY